MITLPGNLSTPTTGPILTCGASARYASGGRVTVLGVESTYAHVYDGAADRRVYAPLDALSLDLESDLGPTIALRWLGRHYGIDVGMTAPEWGAAGWGIWDLRARDGSHVGFTADAATAKKFSDPKRGTVHHVPALANITNPLEALVAACLHAAGVPR